MQQIIISNIMTGGESANVHEEEEQVEMEEDIEHENEHEKHDEEW